MSEAARMTLTALGAGLPLAKPGFNGTVNGAEGETVEVAGGWYAQWLLDQGLASLPLEVQSQVTPGDETAAIPDTPVDMGPPPVVIDGKTAKSLRKPR